MHWRGNVATPGDIGKQDRLIVQSCFVIQPFDGARFDKRFEDVYSPAIKEAGLEPYRVDLDPKVEVPIESIEEGIRAAAICLADITTDNPNVWYELGYAMAAGKPVVMVCSDERKGKHPFDIQHRKVIPYQSESPSDFEKLKQKIKERIEALLEKGEQLRQIAESDPVSPREGLTQPELAIVAVLAGDTVMPDDTSSLYSVRNDVEKAGFTAVGFGLGLRRLQKKNMIETMTLNDPEAYGDGEYTAARLTDVGWDWVEANEKLFNLKIARNQPPPSNFDDIPF